MFAMTSDGQQFFMTVRKEDVTATPISVIVNWAAGLKP
jgi:hypothetical protein